MREGLEIDLAETSLPWGSWFLYLSEEGSTLPWMSKGFELITSPPEVDIGSPDSFLRTNDLRMGSKSCTCTHARARAHTRIHIYTHTVVSLEHTYTHCGLTGAPDPKQFDYPSPIACSRRALHCSSAGSHAERGSDSSMSASVC